MWTLEVWSYMKADESKAVKLTIKLAEKPGPNELAYYRAQIIGQFRRIYALWPDGAGERVA